MSVLSLTPPFFYVIPNFDVLQVELRHMRVKGYDSNGEEQVYDLFIRNDPSLCRPYPVCIVIKDGTLVKVSQL